MANLIVIANRVQEGETVKFRPKGRSMTGKVNSGDLVTVAPLRKRKLTGGSVVLVRVRGRVYLHQIVGIKGDRYLIGNNRGGVNGWVSRKAIYGVMIDRQG